VTHHKKEEEVVKLAFVEKALYLKNDRKIIAY
jgi:hypothetical protein